ncbi:hypothetical protein [Escherichia coli]|uniref:hypothetical protein n=1 Tax=Escherichia coli TaxID=562 RepID=UPI002882DB04|nr:hypothetical protein [Escherichia coli]
MSFSARNIFKILSSFLMQKSPLHEEVCVPEETTAGLWGPLPDSHVVLFLDFDGVCHGAKMKPLSECHWWKNYWINALPW